MEKSMVQELLDTFQDEERKLVLAESCTGGMVSEWVTAVSGASDVFVEGIVCYSNNAKIRRLGVDPETLQEKGAVSEAVAEEMVEGALYVPEATDALSITGIAGPTGGTDEKPVGTVWFAHRRTHRGTNTLMEQFEGDRQAVREKSSRKALEILLDEH